MNIFGIDYGSRMAGTTVITHIFEGKSILLPCAKKQDADTFILEQAKLYKPSCIALDAPLSLPGKYFGRKGYDNFFYRRSDRMLGAMSPMFLGGLTARGMQLKEKLLPLGGLIVEAYPAIWAQRFGLAVLGYKKELTKIPAVAVHLKSRLPFSFPAEAIESWHAIDAILAAYIAFRYVKGSFEAWGDPREGQIYV